MLSPLPLRVCCLAAMAPALTEAATQARAKLTTSDGLSSTVRAPGGSQSGRDCISPSLDVQDHLIKPTGQQKTDPQLVTLPKELLHHSLVDTSHLASAPGKINNNNNNNNTGVPHLGIIKNLQAFSARKWPTRSNIVTTTPKSVAPAMNNGPASSGEKNHSTDPYLNKMPRGGGFPLASAPNNKTPTMGFISKSASQGSGGINTATIMSLQSSTLVPNGPLEPAPEITTQTDDPMQIQEVCNSMTIQTAESQNLNTGMSDVGVLTNVDLVAETTKRQRELERRSERLLRRLRRLQGRQSVTHIQTQLSGLVDHQHQNLQTMAKSMKSQPTNVDLKTELLQSEDVKSLSTAALVDLVVRLQSSQHSLSLRQRLTNPSSPSTSSESSSGILKLDEDLCVEMNRVSSTLQTNLHHLESAVDSDATESSSGGESCDEDYDLDDEKVSRPKL